MRIGLVTCRNIPEPDVDEPLMLDAFRDAGHDVRMIAWDDPGASPSDFDCCVLRSTWNYYLNPQRFLDWVELAGRSTRLFNSPKIVRGNIHKKYLRDLESHGVRIVPTVWVDKDQTQSLGAIFAEFGWAKVVIKPAISAASYRTRQFTRAEANDGQRFLDSLSADGDAMIQQYLDSVEDGGERALVWIDGEFTHAVSKSPRFHGHDEQVSDALELSHDEQTFGERVMSCVEGKPLYARVDIMRGDDGTILLSELELMEPSLFFLQSTAALTRLVQAIERRVS